MYYSTPPAWVNQPTPVLVVGTVSNTILAAPGVGFCYRIVAISLSLTRTAAAAAIVDAFIDDGGLLNYLTQRGFTFNGTSSLYIPLPPPGIQTTENTLVRGSAASTAAGGSFQFMLWYYVDPIN